MENVVKEVNRVEVESPMDLFNSLLEKLKGKPVYKTLSKVIEEKEVTDNEKLKALFSLGTHCVIECEQGRKEYQVIVGMIHKLIESVLTPDYLKGNTNV